MRYFFHIGYHGTNYSGWQIHPDGIGVQQVLEKSLSQVFKKPLQIIGCGRTDAQVHASQFFFHLDVDDAWDFDLAFRLNNLLPDDIAVFDIIPVDGRQHARFDAVQRGYDYFIHTYKDPFLSGFSSMYAVKDWDVGSMNRAAKLLLQYTDFFAFCKMPGRNQHTICNISEAEIFTDNAGDRLRFHISANRFLGKMVRIITGKLIDIGSGKLSVDEFEAHLINPLLPQVIKPAYPQGLYLSKVTYPYLDIPSRSNFTQMLAGDTTWNPVSSA
ncbi:tRNA pseudouridine(38-40) synthase TruA [Mucilaginibacter sp. RB4R14]|uniref:tRNA pseudouridine(38-40) synthase TruA n=1 Tax=Mucilaginibacter aurantiaciroseus TaxID=2949308 RepID=UPI002090BAC4|nr:tRNA pseudouridine(38-40) synthase TruA [Mucilaginibacter aurantiaciroseus]MCO5935705.1 tRNA pseudouridine(38-40) synthase TruA [Mucilaginibacter aurantiaciroseus]